MSTLRIVLIVQTQPGTTATPADVAKHARDLLADSELVDAQGKPIVARAMVAEATDLSDDL